MLQWKDLLLRRVGGRVDVEREDKPGKGSERQTGEKNVKQAFYINVGIRFQWRYSISCNMSFDLTCVLCHTKSGGNVRDT